MTPASLPRYLLLPELRFMEVRKSDAGGVLLFPEKVSEFEAYPRFAMPGRSVHDHRWVRVRDDPIRGDETIL